MATKKISEPDWHTCHKYNLPEKKRKKQWLLDYLVSSDWLVHENMLKFIYSEKATKIFEISTLLLSTVHTDKSKVEISQNFVAFSEYMNFNSISMYLE